MTTTGATAGGPLDTWAKAASSDSGHQLWIAGQPSEAQLRDAKESGITIVVNAREAGEMDWDESGAAEKLGLRYHQIPISGSGPMSRESIAGISRVIADNPDEKILVHCASGNRVAGWLAVHLVEDHGMPIDEALAGARSAGMTKPEMQERVVDYLGVENPE